jgi:ribonucleoside-triphosphate reductase
MGFDPLSDEGVDFGLSIIKTANRLNNAFGKKYNVPVNIEQIPAENTSVKLADKDKILDYNHGEYDFYSNQFIPLTVNADILDRMRLQGVYDEHFSGGSIFHANVENKIEDVELVKMLIRKCAKLGIVYFAINYVLQRCANNHITVGRGTKCACGASIVDELTRVVGFLTSYKTWHKIRRMKDFPNRKFYDEGSLKHADIEYPIHS